MEIIILSIIYLLMTIYCILKKRYTFYINVYLCYYLYIISLLFVLISRHSRSNIFILYIIIFIHIHSMNFSCQTNTKFWERWINCHKLVHIHRNIRSHYTLNFSVTSNFTILHAEIENRCRYGIVCMA